MARCYRFTVRLNREELSTIKKYAAGQHITPSKALRRFMVEALGMESAERGWDAERRKRLMEPSRT
jgi:hypothetical protein